MIRRCDSRRKWSDSAHAILTPHLTRQRSWRGGGACRIVDDQSSCQVSQAPTLQSPAGHITGSGVEPLWLDIGQEMTRIGEYPYPHVSVTM